MSHLRNLIVGLLLLTTNLCFAQMKFSVQAGLGLPELLHAGITAEWSQWEIGVGAGYLNRTSSYVGEVTYHIGGQSMFTEQRPWFIRAGIARVREYEHETGSEIRGSRSVPVFLRIGRVENFSPRTGLKMDMGFMYTLSNEVTSTCDYCDDDGEDPPFPSGSLTFFLRL